MILRGAARFFAEHGFDAKTRELADRIGVSESLIYRYFDTKQDLVDQVYEYAVLDKWRPDWELLLKDRGRSVRQRLFEFYLEYLAAIDNYEWVRIAMRASLDGLSLTRHYISGQVRPVIAAIAEEIQAELETPDKLSSEQVWQLHSTFIYYLIRKHIHRTPVMLDIPEFVSSSVKEYMDGIENWAMNTSTESTPDVR